jgi:hypothetical protein
MSVFAKPAQTDFIEECHRLIRVIGETKRGSAAREHAEHDLKHFLRMNEQGRLAEYFASRRRED